MTSNIIANLSQIIEQANRNGFTNLRIFIPKEEGELNKLHFLVNADMERTSFLELAEFNGRVEKLIGCAIITEIEETLTESGKDAIIKESTIFSQQNIQALQTILLKIIELSQDMDDDMSDEESPMESHTEVETTVQPGAAQTREAPAETERATVLAGFFNTRVAQSVSPMETKQVEQYLKQNTKVWQIILQRPQILYTLAKECEMQRQAQSRRGAPEATKKQERGIPKAEGAF